jgi:hypothetical protein
MDSVGVVAVWAGCIGRGFGPPAQVRLEDEGGTPMRHLGFAKVGLAAVAALALAVTLPRARSADLDPNTQHFEITQMFIMVDACTGEQVLGQETLRTTVHTMANTDGTTTVRMHVQSHGTGTGLRTGTQYVLNYQETLDNVVQNGCNFTANIDIRLALVSSRSRAEPFV